jgi:hypothetical protein
MGGPHQLGLRRLVTDDRFRHGAINGERQLEYRLTLQLSPTD